MAVRLCPVCAIRASGGNGDSSPGPSGGAGRRKERASASFDQVRNLTNRRSRFEHAGTLQAWQHARGTERHAGFWRPWQVRTTGLRTPGASFGTPEVQLARNVCTAMCDRCGIPREPRGTRVSCVAGSAGIDPWRQRCGRLRPKPVESGAVASRSIVQEVLSSKSRRQRRVTAGGVGVSN